MITSNAGSNFRNFHARRKFTSWAWDTEESDRATVKFVPAGAIDPSIDAIDNDDQQLYIDINTPRSRALKITYKDDGSY